jgi:hypothetical protein
MSRSHLEALKEKIEKLDPEEHAQIFAIIQRHTNNYTKTQTGVLVSSDFLNAACLKEIENAVKFYIDQRKMIDTMYKNRIE